MDTFYSLYHKLCCRLPIMVTLSFLPPATAVVILPPVPKKLFHFSKFNLFRINILFFFDTLRVVTKI